MSNGKIKSTQPRHLGCFGGSFQSFKTIQQATLQVLLPRVYCSGEVLL